MANVLGKQKREQIVALGRLGWSLRRIEAETGVRRETASAYPGRPELPCGRWAAGGGRRQNRPKRRPTLERWGRARPRPHGRRRRAADRRPAPASRTASGSRIQVAVAQGRQARSIWQDLVDQHSFGSDYASVQRFVKKLRGGTRPEAHPVIVTAPGEEAQVDYGDGPMVRHPDTSKYRRTRLFVLTLGYSRKSVRLLSWKPSSQIWAELHERAFRRLGGAPRTVVLDNLKEGVLRPDVYDAGSSARAGPGARSRGSST